MNIPILSRFIAAQVAQGVGWAFARRNFRVLYGYKAPPIFDEVFPKHYDMFHKSEALATYGKSLIPSSRIMHEEKFRVEYKYRYTYKADIADPETGVTSTQHIKIYSNNRYSKMSAEAVASLGFNVDRYQLGWIHIGGDLVLMEHNEGAAY